MEHDARRPAFFWVTVLACAVYLVLFAFSTYATVKYFGVRKYPGWTWQLSDGRWVVETVDATGPAAGRLEPGDHLLAVNGDDRSAVLGFRYQLGALKPGEIYRLDVNRQGDRRQVQIRLDEQKTARFGPVFLFYSLIFFSCGATLALLRPRELQIRFHGATMMTIGGAVLGDPDLFAYMSGWERAHIGIIVGIAGWVYPMTYHTFSRFPTGTSPGPVWRAIQWFLYGVFLFFLWPSLIVQALVDWIRAETMIRCFAEYPSVFLTIAAAVRTFFPPYILVCSTALLVVLIWNYRRLRDPGSRRRIRWVVAGMFAAVTPLLVFSVLVTMARIESATADVLRPIVRLATVCGPLSIVLAVWKQQLFDIKVLVRRGVQYLLARNALTHQLRDLGGGIVLTHFVDELLEDLFPLVG